MTTASKRTLFNLGQIVITANAASTLTPSDILLGILRHASGDWGTICPDDAALNDEAVVACDRILSSYRTEGRTLDHHRGGPLGDDNPHARRLLRRRA